MPFKQTVFLLFHGDQPGGRLCELVNRARRANACDLVEKARGAGCFDAFRVITNSEELYSNLAGSVDDLTFTGRGKEFHFGRSLAKEIERSKGARIGYFGSGTAPLLDSTKILKLVGLCGDGMVVANNLYSTDFCIFDSRTLNAVALPKTDNALARVLIESGGLKGVEIPRSSSSLFDIDTPLDLSVLKLAGLATGRLKNIVRNDSPKAEHIKKALKYFTDRKAEVMVAGRVSSDTHSFLDRRTACRIRLLVEERGLAAGGAHSKARSVLGMWMGDNPESAFGALVGRTNAAFIDSRVLLAQARQKVDAEQRYLSDSLVAEELDCGYLKRLTEAAKKAAFPVILAGHSILNPGMMLMVETAWKRSKKDRERVKGLRGESGYVDKENFQEEKRYGTEIRGPVRRRDTFAA